MTTNIKNAKILDLISKENELKSQIALYEMINKEYASIGTIDSVNKKEKLNSLINNMMNINNTIKRLAIDIKNLRNSLTQYNMKLDNLKLTTDSKLNNLLQSIKEEIENLNDIKLKVNDVEGSKKEFSKVYELNNMKYMFWFFITIVLIITIFRGISSSEETNLEKFIFIILIIVTIYYIFMYVYNKRGIVTSTSKSFFDKYKPSIHI